MNGFPESLIQHVADRSKDNKEFQSMVGKEINLAEYRKKKRKKEEKKIADEIIDKAKKLDW